MWLVSTPWEKCESCSCVRIAIIPFLAWLQHMQKIEATRQPERTGAKLMPSEFHQEKIGNSTPERFFHVFPGLFLYVPIKKKTVPKFWTYHIPMGHWVQVLLFQP
jgi:hypothetical protein